MTAPLLPNGTFFFVLAIFLIVLGVIGTFVVLLAAEFLILQPEVAFDDFGRGREAKQSGVSLADPLSVFVGARFGQRRDAGGESCCAGYSQSSEERASLDLAKAQAVRRGVAGIALCLRNRKARVWMADHAVSFLE